MNDISKQQQPLKKRTIRIELQGPKANEQAVPVPCAPHNQGSGDIIREAREYVHSVLGKRGRDVAARPISNEMEVSPTTPNPAGQVYGDFYKASSFPRRDKWDWLWDRMVEDSKEEADWEPKEENESVLRLLEDEDPYHGKQYGLILSHDIDETDLFCNE